MRGRSASALLHGPQGYEPRGVLAFDVTLSDARYSDPEAQRGFVRDALTRSPSCRGSRRSRSATRCPGATASRRDPIAVEGQPLAQGSEPPQVEARVATPALFATLKLPLLSGRGLEAADLQEGRPVAVVSRAFAERFWPGQDPIGKRFRMLNGELDTPWLAVVGVSGDVIHQWVLRRHAPTFYRPFVQAPSQDLSFALRTSGDPEALAASVRRALAAVDPDQPAYQLRSLRRRSGSPRSACSTSPASWRRSACWRWCWPWAASTE